MDIQIRWKDITKSDAVISHLESKVAKFEDFAFIGETLKVEFVYYPHDNEYKVRMVLSVKHSGSLKSEACSKDILTSINDCVQKLTGQLRKEKTKRYV